MIELLLPARRAATSRLAVEGEKPKALERRVRTLPWLSPCRRRKRAVPGRVGGWEGRGEVGAQADDAVVLAVGGWSVGVLRSVLKEPCV